MKFNKIRRPQRGHLLLTGEVLLMCLLYLVSAVTIDNGERCYSGILQLQTAVPSMEQKTADALMEEAQGNEKTKAASDGTKYTLWTQKQGQELVYGDTGRSSKADILYFYGASQHFFQLATENGCAISEETAYALWGTKDAAGRQLQIAGETFLVERVMEKGSLEEQWTGGAVTARWHGEDEMLFDVMTISDRSSRFSEDGLLNRGDLAGAISVDYEERLAALRCWHSVPLWAAAVMSVFFMAIGIKEEMVKWRRVATLRDQRVSWPPEVEQLFWRSAARAGLRSILLALWAVALLGAVSIAAGPPVFIAQRFIPSQWSDFSFWSETIKNISAAYWQADSLPQYGPDLAFTQLALVVKAAATMQIVLLCAAVNWLGRKGIKWLRLH